MVDESVEEPLYLFVAKALSKLRLDERRGA
jgi:hypothetical protein